MLVTIIAPIAERVIVSLWISRVVDTADLGGARFQPCTSSMHFLSSRGTAAERSEGAVSRDPHLFLPQEVASVIAEKDADEPLFQQHCTKNEHPSFMFRATCAAAMIATTLLSGCSGQHTLNNEKLKSAATEIISIAAEGELFATTAADNHLPANYVKGHPEYLHQQAEEVTIKLRQGLPEAHDQDQLALLRHAATQLMETLDALPSTANDPRWQRSRAQFDRVRQEAAEIRQTL